MSNPPVVVIVAGVAWLVALVIVGVVVRGISKPKKGLG